MNYRYWLRRGLGIKRWILLATGGAVLAPVGLLALVGRDLVSLIEGHGSWLAVPMRSLPELDNIELRLIMAKPKKRAPVHRLRSANQRWQPGDRRHPGSRVASVPLPSPSSTHQEGVT